MKMTLLLPSFTILERHADGRPKKVSCKVDGCSWTSVANQTRMEEHLKKKHPNSGRAQEESASSSTAQALPDEAPVAPVQPPKKQRFKEISAFLDRKLSPNEDEACADAQARMVVLAGLPLDSQQHPATLQFYKALRPSFKPLSRCEVQKCN